MIAEETTTERLDELRHVLRTSLLKTGIMGTLRAQLRSSAIDILKGNDGNGLKDVLETHEVPEEGSPEHFATLLVFDFLNHFPTLKRSSGIFSEESGLSLSRDSFGVNEAKHVSKDLKLNNFSPQEYQNEPLLVTAVKQMMSGQQQKQQTASSSAVPSARHSPAPAPKSPVNVDDQHHQQQDEEDIPETPRSQPPPPTASPKKSEASSSSSSSSGASFFTDLMKNASSDSSIQQKIKQSMPQISDKKFRTKELKDSVVDGKKIAAAENQSDEIGDWDDVENVDKEFAGNNNSKSIATVNDVNIVTGSSSSSSPNDNKTSSSSSVTATTQPQLPVFGQLPPLTHHAKTLAPLDGPSAVNKSNNNNLSGSSSLSQQQQNQNQASSSSVVAPTPVSYEDDFDEEDDDDDTF